MTTSKTCIVNEIDGEAFQSVDQGPLDEVRARADDRLKAQIDAAIAAGGKATETFERDDGESYTIKVIVKD